MRRRVRCEGLLLRLLVWKGRLATWVPTVGSSSVLDSHWGVSMHWGHIGGIYIGEDGI